MRGTVWLLWGVYAFILVAEFLVGMELNHRARELARDTATLTAELSAADDARRTALAAYAFERAQCDKMFLWYEYCLDERTCTEAGPGLTLWRKFPTPVFADRRLPDVPWKPGPAASSP